MFTKICALLRRKPVEPTLAPVEDPKKRKPAVKKTVTKKFAVKPATKAVVKKPAAKKAAPKKK